MTETATQQDLQALAAEIEQLELAIVAIEQPAPAHLAPKPELASAIEQVKALLLDKDLKASQAERLSLLKTELSDRRAALETAIKAAELEAAKARVAALDAELEQVSQQFNSLAKQQLELWDRAAGLIKAHGSDLKLTDRLALHQNFQNRRAETCFWIWAARRLIPKKLMETRKSEREQLEVDL